MMRLGNQVLDGLVRAYLPVLDAYKTSLVGEALNESEPNLYLEREALTRMQRDALKQVIDHARATVPYYRFIPEDFSLHGHALTQSEVLSSLPLLTKGHVFENFQSIKSSAPRGNLQSASTSGSTGIAMRFYCDGYQDAWAQAGLWRARRLWHVSRHDRQVVLWARPLVGQRGEFVSGLKYRMRNVVNYNTFDDFDEAKMAEIVESLQAFAPRLVYGYGSSIARLARFMVDNDRCLIGRARPAIVEYTADHMFEHEVHLAARAFGAPILSQYGASETPAIAFQCWAGNSHMCVDHAYVEFLRPDGSAAEPDEDAEIVVTTLRNYGMPFIRYRVGDRGSFRIGQCRCGITLPMMNLTVGKAVDIVSTSSHKGVSAHVFDYINLALIRRNQRGVRQFFVEQTGLDAFTLDIVKERPFEQASVNAFVDMMRERLGAQISVQIRFVEDIPISASGKRRYFKKSFEERE